MTYFSGQHGEIFIKAASSSGSLGRVGSLKNWSLNMQMAVLDTTVLSATDRTLINGVRSYTGSASMLYYQENDSNVKKMIEHSFFAGNSANYNAANYGRNTPPQEVELKLRLFEGGNNRDIDCICFITSFSISCAVGEVVTAEISFEGTGLPTGMSMIT